MRALLGVEIRRILARRIVWVAGTAAILGLLIGGTVLFVRSHRTNAAVERSLATVVESQRQQAVAECTSGIDPARVPPGITRAAYCDRIVGTISFQSPSFHLTHYREVAEGMTGVLAVLLALLGASFAGAEWHAGTVGTQLTWEPRRSRLFGAKTAMAMLFAFVAFLGFQLLLAAVVAPAAVFRGTTAGIDRGWLWSTLGMLVRGGIVAALAAAVGFSLATLGRNTGMAIGALFVYLAVLEPLIRGLRPAWQRWALYDNVATFVLGHPAGFTFNARSTAGAGVVIVAYSVAVGAITLQTFRVRDVT